MTQLDNRKEPSQGPVGGSEAQEREAFEAQDQERFGCNSALYEARRGVEYIDRPIQYRWETWQAARATAAAPAAPVRMDGMTERERELLREIRVHFQSTLAPSWQAEAKALLLRLENAPAAHPPAAVRQDAIQEAIRVLEGVAMYSPSEPNRQAAKRAIAALSVPSVGVGCAFCTHPLYAGTKCKNCGRVTDGDGRAGEVPAVMDAWRDVLAERERQKTIEGWTPEHDDEHGKGEMALASACYAAHTATWEFIGSGLDSKGGLFRVYQNAQEFVGRMWPWGREWWKPKDERSNLVRAGALILAEIERLDRAAMRAADTNQGQA